MLSSAKVHHHTKFSSPLYHDENGRGLDMPLLGSDDCQVETTNTYYTPDESRLDHLKSRSMVMGCALGAFAPTLLLLESPMIRTICSVLDVKAGSEDAVNAIFGVWILFCVVIILAGVVGLMVFSRVILSNIPFAFGVCEDALDRAKCLLCRRFALGVMLGMLVPEVPLDLSCRIWDTDYCLTTSGGISRMTVVLTVVVVVFWYFETRRETSNKEKKQEDHDRLSVVTL